MRTLQFSSNSFVNGKHIIIEQSRRKNSISSRRNFHFSIAPLLLDTPNVSVSTPRWRVTTRSCCFCFRSLFSFSILLFIIVRANALPRKIWNQHTHATQLRQIYLPITHKLRTSYSKVTRVSFFLFFRLATFRWCVGVLECWSFISCVTRLLWWKRPNKREMSAGTTYLCVRMLTELLSNGSKTI